MRQWKGTEEIQSLGCVIFCLLRPSQENEKAAKTQAGGIEVILKEIKVFSSRDDHMAINLSVICFGSFSNCIEE
jgi:hypothetical protein